MTALLPEDGDGWLRLLGVALKSVVQKLLQDADITTHLSSYTENRKSYLTIGLMNKDDEDGDDDIYVGATIQMEDAVAEMIDREFKPEGHSENMRAVAKHFRELAQQLDDAAK
jgi:hypothetical protein